MQFLDHVEIPERAHKYPAELSGGQQQWVAIARDVADPMAFFDERMLVEEGTRHQIFNNPQEDRTRMFLEQILKRVTR